MNAEQIKQLISQEINQNTITSNLHVHDVKEHLIEPVEEVYIDSFDESQELMLWTVFEEFADRSGYKIVYDPRNNTYGLGILAKNNGLMFIGYYGSFTETYSGM